MRDYALYKGDEVICVGTIQEIADTLGIKPSTVREYGTESYRKRTKGGMELVEIEEGDE